MAQRGAQELGRHLEVTVGLELGLARWPHLVQHEDGADPGQKRPQQMMRSAEIECFQSGADDVVAKLFH